jgi:uncharacterized protein YoxC
MDVRFGALMNVLLSLLWSTVPLQAALTDTIVTKQIVERTWWQVLIDIEQAIVPLMLLALLFAVAFGVFKLARGVQEATKILHASSADISGAAHSVRTVAEDVRGITTSVRGDVEEVGVTVRAVNDGVRAAAGRFEERLRRLDALAEVAQEEAEDFVMSTASTLRGVRQGASVFRKTFLFRRNGSGQARKRRKAREREERRREHERQGERPRIRRHVPDEA